MIDLHKVIEYGWPTSSYRLSQPNTYAQLEWLDENIAKPSESEVNAKSAELDALAYRESRRIEYPSIGDQLDALWKGGQAATDMLAKVQAIKTKYPKPQ